VTDEQLRPAHALPELVSLPPGVTARHAHHPRLKTCVLDSHLSDSAPQTYEDCADADCQPSMDFESENHREGSYTAVAVR